MAKPELFYVLKELLTQSKLEFKVKGLSFFVEKNLVFTLIEHSYTYIRVNQLFHTYQAYYCPFSKSELSYLVTQFAVNLKQNKIEDIAASVEHLQYIGPGIKLENHIDETPTSYTSSYSNLKINYTWKTL